MGHWTGRAAIRFSLAGALCLAPALLPATASARAAEAPHPRPATITNEAIWSGALDGRPVTRAAWSPDGTRVVFSRREPDSRSSRLYLYDVPTGRTRPVTAADDDTSKLVPSSWSWSPDGGKILAEAAGDLYLLDPADDTPAPPRRLTSTPASEDHAAFSPDGRSVGFARDGDLFVLDLDSMQERRLTTGGSEAILNGSVDWVYEEEFDLRTAWWWSPDSSHIAYLQFDQREVPRYPIVDLIPIHPEVRWQRYPKAGDANPTVRIGIVPAAAPVPAADAPIPDTRFINVESSPDIYFPRVAWTPDGRLAVERLDRSQTHLDLLVCDPATGAARRLLGESDPYWINIGDDWRFLPDGRLLWGSERDGYRHLYLYAPDGGLIRRVTDGGWAVASLEAVDPKEGVVFFTGSRDGAAQRHLYRVRLDGSDLTRLTREPGWHRVTVSGATGGWVDSRSTAVDPPRVTVRRPDGTVAATLDESAAKAIDGTPAARVEFHDVPADDGTRLPAVMTLPPDFDPSRRYPVLVYVYGGPHAQNVRDDWGGTRALWHRMMAARGYIVWTLDNRGAGGYGHAWETPIHHVMGRVELSDQLAGVAWLKTRPYVDPARIGIWGWSYGGYMTLYALFNAPDAFTTGVAVAPVTDWRDYDTIYTERYMGTPSENPDGYRDSSPINAAENLKAPLLLVHGSADDNVHMQNSVQLLDRLIAADRPVRFMLYPGKNHGIPGAEARTHLFEMITRYIEDHL